MPLAQAFAKEQAEEPAQDDGGGVDKRTQSDHTENSRSQ